MPEPFYQSSLLIKLLYLVICGDGNYWHAPGNVNCKWVKCFLTLNCSLLSGFECWPPESREWSNVLCGGFYLFYDNIIIYIWMRCGVGLRNTILKEPFPTGAAILMAGATPAAAWLMKKWKPLVWGHNAPKWQTEEVQFKMSEVQIQCKPVNGCSHQRLAVYRSWRDEDHQRYLAF